MLSRKSERRIFAKTWGLCVCSLIPDLLSPHFATLCLCLCLCLCPPCVCSLFYPHTLPKSPQPQPTLCHFDLMWRLPLPPTYFRVPFKHLQATCKSMTSLFSLMRKLMRLFMFWKQNHLGTWVRSMLIHSKTEILEVQTPPNLSDFP